jgi:hypothetical protein
LLTGGGPGGRNAIAFAGARAGDQEGNMRQQKVEGIGSGLAVGSVAAGALWLAAAVVVSAGCGGGEGKTGREDLKAARNDLQLLIPLLRETNTMDEVGEVLGLKQVRPRVWLARESWELGKKIDLPVPIEIITDPVVVERVSKGLRPDGEKMYSYPDEMPEGYPPEWIEYAIDIYPQKIPESEGIKTGRLVLYGHFVEPPYKIQIAIGDVADKGSGLPVKGKVLVNGIDLELPTNKKAREIRRAVELSSKIPSTVERIVDFHQIHEIATRSLVDSLVPVVGEDETIRLVTEVLRQDPHVIEVKAGMQAKQIYYKVAADDQLEFRRQHPEAFEAFWWSYCHEKWIHLRKSRPASLGQVVRGRIHAAGNLSKKLARGWNEYGFGTSGTGSMNERDHQILAGVCRAPRPYEDDALKVVKRIMAGSTHVEYLLSNCSR